eukprot:CAMPEP_0206453820 /NCGR_PEP_ID=MMETSP0324_2-20121206/20771_1 /ASSEMBLY_ACC=CAM_ASM_000836 /TAXON_ID=2866 /ORGANISM="Crypthecodinium cohnii, Strain Seligo" /LENGTH=57 /DNA_ID=CAMNT_0053924179 /DNA_START=980 /DNA_END=1153 /DNA_ORIENTATION=+
MGPGYSASLLIQRGLLEQPAHEERAGCNCTEEGPSKRRPLGSCKTGLSPERLLYFKR